MQKPFIICIAKLLGLFKTYKLRKKYVRLIGETSLSSDESDDSTNLLVLRLVRDFYFIKFHCSLITLISGLNIIKGTIKFINQLISQ